MYKFTWDFNFNKEGGTKANIAALVNEFGLPTTIVEIGSYEGLTTFWMNDEIGPLNPNLKIYSIDPHGGSIDIKDDFNTVAENFHHNMQVCKNNKITHINKKSEHGLVDLINQRIEAELIYIDGDHTAGTVLTDLVLSWQILKNGGVILCDDTVVWKYKDNNGACSAQLSPRLAVETFIQCHWHELEILPLPNSTQTAFRKII